MHVMTFIPLLIAVLLLQNGLASGQAMADAAQLIVEFDGVNSRVQMIEFLAQLRSTFGEKTFPTEPYKVQKNDTWCAIYGQRTKLPVTASVCPQAVEDLGVAINPETKGALRPNQTIDLPAITVETYRQQFAVKTTTQPAQLQWPGYVLRANEDGAGYIAQKETYVLRIPTTEPIAKGAVDLLGQSPKLGISAYISSAGIGIKKSAQSAAWKTPGGTCAGGAGADQNEGAFFYLFDWLQKSSWRPSDDIWQCVMQCRATHSDQDSACADIVLVDAPVTQHKDIYGLVQPLDREGQLQSASEPEMVNTCQVVDNLLAKDHGTHLASIIASRADGSGFVGMSPGLDIYAYPWDTETGFKHLRELIHMRTNTDPTNGLPTYLDRGPQVFVFASHFPAPDGSKPYSYPQSAMDGSRLKDNVQAGTANALSKAVIDSHLTSIWVVAAMQKSGTITSIEQVHDKLGFSPVNLGNFKNVISVSVCERCRDGDALLWSDAFWGKPFVHVAAPGLQVRAPVGPGQLAQGGGTSQATALVGGLVAGMINCYRKQYSDQPQSTLNSGLVKLRLQITSRPILYRDEDLKKIAAGVVDPRAALLNPDETWIMKPDAQNYTKLVSAPDHWCDKQLELEDDAGNVIRPHTENIYRLFHIEMPGADGTAPQRRWVIYAHGARSERSENNPRMDVPIERYDPRKLTKPHPDAKLIQLKDGTFLRLKDFDDLILSELLGRGRC